MRLKRPLSARAMFTLEWMAKVGGFIFIGLSVTRAIEPGHPPVTSAQYLYYVGGGFVSLMIGSFLVAQLLWKLGFR